MLVKYKQPTLFMSILSFVNRSYYSIYAVNQLMVLWMCVQSWMLTTLCLISFHVHVHFAWLVYFAWLVAVKIYWWIEWLMTVWVSLGFTGVFHFQLALYFHLQESIEKSLKTVAKATTDCLFGSMATSQPAQLVQTLHNLERIILGEKKRSQLLKASAWWDCFFRIRIRVFLVPVQVYKEICLAVHSKK